MAIRLELDLCGIRHTTRETWLLRRQYTMPSSGGGDLPGSPSEQRYGQKLGELKPKMSTDDRLEKLKHFFEEVADLTVNHKVIADHAAVYPSDLGEALSRVDPDWCHNRDVRRGNAMMAHYRISTLTRSLPLPKGVRYAVRCADNYKSIAVLLMSKRKYLRWPNWDKIASLVPCEKIIEDEDPNMRVPRKTLYF